MADVMDMETELKPPMVLPHGPGSVSPLHLTKVEPLLPYRVEIKLLTSAQPHQHYRGTDSGIDATISAQSTTIFI